MVTVIAAMTTASGARGCGHAYDERVFGIGSRYMDAA
jgi:hypothetical protein